MITAVLIYLLLAIALTGFAVFCRRLFLYPKSENEKLPPAPKPASLFAATDAELRSFEKEESGRQRARRRAEIRENLFRRAAEGDLRVLSEAAQSADAGTYPDLLDLLTERNKLEPAKLEELTNFLSQNNLPASRRLAEKALQRWSQNPSTASLPKVLHLSVLTDSADIYLKALETAADCWRRQRLQNISGAELMTLFDRHFRLLSTDSRTSGAGFLIKEKLASVRREVSGK